MLVKMSQLLQAAEADAYALGAFNIYNLEGVNAVIAATEILESPAILQLHPASLKHGGSALIALALEAANTAKVPVAVHLDHSSEFQAIETALSAGIPSVMADGSHLSYEENLAFVQKSVALAHQYGATVEAELGRISGTEDGLTVDTMEAQMTDPAQAADFVAQTGIDALAVCIGNIHGKYPFPPRLDFERLRAIREAVTLPLVLHGASGLDSELIRDSIRFGVRKFNVNTEVRGAYLDSLRHELEKNPKIDLIPLMQAVQTAMQAIVSEKLKLFASIGKARVLMEF